MAQSRPIGVLDGPGWGARRSKGNGSRRRVDVAVPLAEAGRIQLVSRYFFSDPKADACQQLVGRLFEVEEVRAVEIVASRTWAQIEYTSGVVPWRDVIGKIARHLQNGHDGARVPSGDPPPDLPIVVDAAGGWRIERRAIDRAGRRVFRPEDAPSYREQRWSTREFVISALSLVMAGIGAVFYPPLGPLSVPPQVYVHRRLYVHGVRLLVRERTVTVDILVTGLSVAALLHGYFFIYSLGGLLLLCTKNLLEKVKQDSRADYADVFRQQARTVWVRVDGVEIETPLDAVEVGDVVAIAAGQTIPVDGSIVEGAATVDQHVMTGEAIPAEKGVGERVLALTVVLSGKIYVRVEKTGSATAAAHIAQVLERTVDFKTGRQLRAERVSGRLLVPALLAGLVTWPVFGASAGLAVVDSHPRYKTTLASSIGLLNYFKLAARQGLLIKDGRTLEVLNDVDTVVFDKTGTLTLAQPHLARLHACSSHTETEVLAFAAAAEQHQPHPIAAAILDAARASGVSIPATTEADYRVGYGLTVTIDRATVRVGSMRFMEMEAMAVPPALRDVQARCHDEGHALVLVAVDGALAGALELHTTVRPEARRIVDGLRRRGITSMYVMSGDHERPTRRLAEALGIERYFAETLPENKALLIERLVGEGKVVCYVGDGINDSIAMKTSHVSVSLRGASTVATDTAEVILLDASLNQLCALFDLARDCNRNMRLIIAAVVGPGLVCLGGVLFGGFTFLESRMLNYVSIGTGVGAAMLPSLTSTVPRRPRSPRRLRIPRRRRERGT